MSKRLKDVLDDNTLVDKTFWDKMFDKMGMLLTAIENYKGPAMSMDDSEYRWVKDRLEYWDSEDRTLSKEEMKVANKMWKQYNK